MPARLNAKGPGEFIRDHLQDPQTGGRDYVGAMYQAYKGHLRTAGIRKLPCRPVFHKYIWLLKETGAIIFDGAEAISFGSSPPRDLPPDYEPACGMPAPRHYYRILDSQNPAFAKPEAVWRQRRGLAPAQPAPRPVQIRVVTQPITPAPPRVTPPAPAEPVLRQVAISPFELPPRPARRSAQRLVTHLRRLDTLGPETPEVDRELERLEDELQGWVDEMEEAVGKEEDKEEPNEDRLDRLQEQREALEEAVSALGDRDVGQAVDALGRAFPAAVPQARRLTLAERMEEEARAFRPRIEALRASRDLPELDRLDQEMVGFFDRVLDTAERSRGENKQQLLALAQRFERAAESFEQARAALTEGRDDDYLAALDRLAQCCP